MAIYLRVEKIHLATHTGLGTLTVEAIVGVREKVAPKKRIVEEGLKDHREEARLADVADPTGTL